MQNIKHNKKAVSEVITTIVIVFLVVVCIALLGLSVNNFIKKEVNFSPQISCIKIQASPPANIVTACYNYQTNKTEITLKRSVVNDFEIQNLGFTLSNQDTSEEFLCGNSCGVCNILEVGKTKTYFLSNTDSKTNLIPTEITLKTSNCVLETKSIDSC